MYTALFTKHSTGHIHPATQWGQRLPCEVQQAHQEQRSAARPNPPQPLAHTQPSGEIWGSVSCPRILQHAAWGSRDRTTEVLIESTTCSTSWATTWQVCYMEPFGKTLLETVLEWAETFRLNFNLCRWLDKPSVFHHLLQANLKVARNYRGAYTGSYTDVIFFFFCRAIRGAIQHYRAC